MNRKFLLFFLFGCWLWPVLDSCTPRRYREVYVPPVYYYRIPALQKHITTDSVVIVTRLQVFRLIHPIYTDSFWSGQPILIEDPDQWLKTHQPDKKHPDYLPPLLMYSYDTAPVAPMTQTVSIPYGKLAGFRWYVAPESNQDSVHLDCLLTDKATLTIGDKVYFWFIHQADNDILRGRVFQAYNQSWLFDDGGLGFPADIHHELSFYPGRASAIDSIQQAAISGNEVSMPYKTKGLSDRTEAKANKETRVWTWGGALAVGLLILMILGVALSIWVTLRILGN